MVAAPWRRDRLTDDAVFTVAGVGETMSAGGIGSSVTDPDCEAAGC